MTRLQHFQTVIQTSLLLYVLLRLQEDLPDASFAGQQETFLNIRGIDNVLIAIKKSFASLYNDRAIAYRVHQGFEHSVVALSAGVQRMVRSETGYCRCNVYA